MDKKVIGKSAKIIVFSFLCILLFLSYFIFQQNNLEIDGDDFIIEGIVFILGVNILLNTLDLRMNFISFGIFMICFSYLNDFFDEVKLIKIPDKFHIVQDVIFKGVFQALGLIIITYGVSKAIKERERFLDELKGVAFKDFLTNLPNRRGMKEKLASFIEEASKNSRRLGVLFIDLDEFKIINDTFGHSIGDKLLKKVSARLRHVIRGNDMVARLGGDEFVVVLHDIENYNELDCIANRIIGSFKRAFILNGIHIHISCSIGISVFPDNGGDLDMLFKNADIAMYRAKENGKNNYEIYNDSMNHLSVRRLEVAEGLRKGLERKEFYLMYQPKVNMSTGEITGLEALLRWNHPKLGLLYPEDFIQIAEETGIIKEIDEYVLRLVSTQIKAWIDDDFKPVNIAVNISPQLFNEKTFIKRVDNIFKKTNVDPSFISIEITETTAMENKDYALNILKQLKEYNIQIHLDDFGTGYSSLCYLKVFPVDVLKIDKLFIDGIVKDKKDESIIKSLIKMAKSLDIKVISEGVETIQQFRFLQENQCDEYQGYLFSKPLPMEEIEKKLGFDRKVSNPLGRALKLKGENRMLYRKFGPTEEMVSILSLGCMRLPTIDEEPKNIDEEKAIEMIRYSVDNGVNYVDTAYPYHGGMSEYLVGKALGDGYRERVYLATKLPSWLIESRGDMDKYLNEQLERLRTEYIDFYLVHTLNQRYWKNLRENGLFEFLDSILEDGRVKYVGFSFHDEVELFKEIVDAYDWTFCQIQYNFIDEDYQAGKEGLKYAAEAGLGIVIMEPLRGGRLASRVPGEIMDVWNSAEIKRTPVEWALRYLWNYGEISTVLSGMSTLEQIKENINYADEGLSSSLKEEEKELIFKVSQMYKEKIKVNCTVCKYCLPCPVGVAIPSAFELYNDAMMFGSIEDEKKRYNMLIKEEARASKCVECGECEEVCPQNIPIREKLRDVVEAFGE